MTSFVEKRIKNLTSEDSLVAVSGIVVNLGSKSFMIDDGTGQAGIYFENYNLEEGNYVRVFGRISKVNDSVEVQANFVQTLDDMDKNFHRQIIEKLL